MAEEAKNSINVQSLAQFLTIAVVLITCAVAIERRLTTLEIGQSAPLSDKQKAAIHEEVKAFLQQLYKADEGEEETTQPKKTPQKTKPKAKPKITGQLGPLRADEPLPTYAEHSLPRVGDFKDGGK